MKSLFVLMTVFVSQISFAQQTCPAVGPTVECMDYVLPSVSYDRVRAAQTCKSGASVKCMDYILPSVSYNKVKAAETCKAGVTVECMDYVLASVSYNKVKAAEVCAP